VIPLLALAACGSADPRTAPIHMRPAVLGEGLLVVSITRSGGAGETLSTPVVAADFPVPAYVPDDVERITAALYRDDALVADGVGTAAGVTLEPVDVRVDSTGERPQLADRVVAGQQLASLGDGSFAIVWEQDQLVRARSYDAHGRPREIAGGERGEVRIAPRVPDDFAQVRLHPRLFAAGDGLIFTHEAERPGEGDTLTEVARLSDALVVDDPMAAEVIAGARSERSASVAARPGGGLAVAWLDTEDSITWPDPYGQIHVATLGADGRLVHTAALAGPLRMLPQLAPCGDGYALVFLEWQAGVIRLVAQRLDARGVVAAEPVELARDLVMSDDVARVAASGDGAVVVWTAPDDGEVVVRARRIDDGGAPRALTELARGASVHGVSTAATGDGSVLVAWSAGDDDGTARVSWTRLDAALHPLFPPAPARISAHGQLGPSITPIGDGVAALAWTEQLASAPLTRQIRARIVYPPDGAPGAPR
jgi:hypothetical protein